jgi:CRP-like cAMP-binding protein
MFGTEAVGGAPGEATDPSTAASRFQEVSSMTRLNGHATLQQELAAGRRKLSERFHSSPPRIFGAGKSLAEAERSSGIIYHLQAGWACQFRQLPDRRQAIVDVYLPGDVIGLDAVFRTRPLENVMSLTSIAVEAIEAEEALAEMMSCRPTALYVAWLLSHRQRRADRLLAAISCLDARGQLATMVLDFYTRLRRRRLITGLTFNLPLTQVQIGCYLGLTVVHVNRVLRSLRDERIVHLERHCLSILDLERLYGLAQAEGPENPSVGAAERPPDEAAVAASHAAE